MKKLKSNNAKSSVLLNPGNIQHVIETALTPSRGVEVNFIPHFSPFIWCSLSIIESSNKVQKIILKIITYKSELIDLEHYCK